MSPVALKLELSNEIYPPLHAFSSYQGRQTTDQYSESALENISPNGRDVFGIFNNYTFV
jgi:hypothetical protein